MSNTLELDEIGLLEWRVYELEGRLAVLAYNQAKVRAARSTARHCLSCGKRTEREEQVCLRCSTIADSG